MGSSCLRLATERGHGSWYLRLELGAGLEGRRRRVRRGGFPSRRAATDALRRLRGPTRRPVTVAEWLSHWLEGVAVICQQIQQRNGQIVAGPPKTPHSMRVIALDRSTIAALRTHQERQRAEQACYGEGYRESGYVFTNRDGDPVAPGNLTHTFQRLVRENDVPPTRLHDLRHGAATLALAAGVELKVVQEMLGHCSIVLTADTYTSVLPEVARTAAEKPPRT
jgi:hypothetical protein